MSNTNQIKFYQALESIFVGANIEGDSGYVNLLKIKSSYYKIILEQFKNEVTKEQMITDSFKEEFFDKLYSFFEKYFSESGSVYFVKTANWQRVYEQVYTDNKDVVLFWKTHMLYYVKSDILFQSMDVEIKDEETRCDYNFYFDVGELKARQNNEKKNLVFTYRETKTVQNSEEILNEKQGKKTYIIDVTYSQQVSYKGMSEEEAQKKKEENKEKTKNSNIENIAKQLKIPESIIEKAFRTFKKQSEVDFFINKNADKFLREQLDMYLHQILMTEENKFEQKRLDQLKTFKTFATKIIRFIAQFEDELVRVWNKPKFAKDSHYVITLDKLSSELITKIAKHKNLQDQIAEWQVFAIVESDFTFQSVTNNGLIDSINPKFQYLPIDTKYFKDLEIDILSQFDNLDEAIDGRLIHSENYQALNTLQNKYKEKVQCIYIDPPFNTGSDFAYVDKFQDSTWLSLMSDRIELARKFLRDDGSFYLHLDDNADYWGRMLMNNIFGKENYRNNVIWTYNGKGLSNVSKKFIPYYSNFYVYSKNQNELFLNNKKEGIAKSVIQRFGKLMNEFNQITFAKLKEFNESSELEKAYKSFIKENGAEPEDTDIAIDYNKGTYIKDIWDDIGIIRNSSAYTESIDFNTQKPEKLLERILTASSDDNTLIMDFFTGSATTIATAHKLGRKWLGVEMGDHFYTVDIPRMKTVLSGKMSGISKDLEKDKKLKKGGLFKYYTLEQYEDSLRNMKYKDSSPNSIFDTRKPFEQYIFYADKKFADVIVDSADKTEFDLNFDALYPNIDFPETISNLLGLPIKRITISSVVLEDGETEREIKIDYKTMTEIEKLELIKILKPAIWWGN
jgi:adenine-specific DNA-methyltransferase